MEKRILVDFDTVAFLKKEFGVSRTTVWRALTFKTDGYVPRHIRKLALERGGRLTDGNPVACTTTHDQANKTMTQTFGDRFKIIVDMGNGNVTVWKDNEIDASYHNLTISEFMKLQRTVEARYMNSL